MLFDAGNPGARDAKQIAAVAKEAGVKQIDYLVISHWHADHFGSVPDLSTRLPIRNFVDHGPPMIETSENALAGYKAYAAIRDKGHYMPVKRGDKIPIKGLDVQVVTSDGVAITSPLLGGGASNPLCREFKPIVENAAAVEDGRSTGIVVRFGRFRAIELGDLTWTKEYALVCPTICWVGSICISRTATGSLPDHQRSCMRSNLGSPSLTTALGKAPPRTLF